MKCLPQKSIARAQGVVLHDWHAEVLAIRSFNRFLLEECFALATKAKISSDYVHWRDEHEMTTSHFQPFALNEGLKLHMYCSEAPCMFAKVLCAFIILDSLTLITGGDASMELTMASQEDATPWSLPNSSEAPPDSLEPSEISPSTTGDVLHGRSYFSALGIVRRKPSRPDAPPTLSKSCSDKLALKQSTSLLGSLTSLLISPQNIYIHTLVLPSSQLSVTATTRAFSSSGRLEPLSGRQWDGGYAFCPFRMLSTSKEFSFSRRSGGKPVPSNISTSWTPNGSETMIGGTLQGRKQFNIRGAAKVCKRRMWRLALQAALAADKSDIANYLSPKMEGDLSVQGTYRDIKGSRLLEDRRKVKRDARDVLAGWVRNEGGDGFGFEGVEL